MTTETAQRRLLETLATVRNTPNLDHGQAANPLAATAVGLRFAAEAQAESGSPELLAMGRINAAVAALCEAVDNDMTTKESSQ